LHGVTVGHSELDDREPELGRARGAFRPGLGYELVQPVFRIYAHAVPPGGPPADELALQRYYKARDALNLELVDASGRVIKTSAIHIEDYTVEAGPAAITLDVLIKDPAYWGEADRAHRGEE
jgi:hypothetical protein